MNTYDLIEDTKGVKTWKSYVPSTTGLRNWFTNYLKSRQMDVPVITENITMSVKYLKVKIKSLATEATIIRKEEHSAKAQYRYLKDKQGLEKQYDEAVSTFWGLRSHRTIDVRNEARAAQLAYAFVRGKSFKYVEANTNIGYWSDHHKVGIIYEDMKWLLDRVARLSAKYGNVGTTVDDIEAWMLADVTKESSSLFLKAEIDRFKRIENRLKSRKVLTPEERAQKKSFWEATHTH